MAVSLHLPSAESSKSRVPGVALWKDDERCKTNAQHNSLQRYVEFHILGSSCAGNLCARESHRSEGNAILEEMTQEEQGKKKEMQWQCHSMSALWSRHRSKGLFS